ncbi:Phenazine biosynthesis-like domain-containing protein 2 [Hypsibius exemplaris]|uniref:Phenazine biosynthesis-like domain-containing protein 2 n=1 Tax=Hypsibius exemplaris TaxID=2072580 RepID=A0A1W0WPT4_HYPEX|nr:Phenazine biosynthesis-like domain-containing protein 2 [Hypsibius exemplaris]
MATPVQGLPIYIVDVFAKKALQGSPAAVCFLQSDTDLPAEVKQKIAAEMNQSVTAFIVASTPSVDAFTKSDEFSLRWFTPTTEMALCGHASLATTSLLYTVYGNTNNEIRYNTKSGIVVASRKGDAFALDFPQNLGLPLDEPTRSDLHPLLEECNAIFGAEKIVDVVYALGTRNLLIRLQDDVDLATFPVEPSRFSAVYDNSVKTVKLNGIIVTVKGSPKKGPENGEKEYDFISRYFGPWIGVPEDYVCGSAHTTLAPYWSALLGRTAKHARQVSQRPGDLLLDILPAGRMVLAGNCTLILKAQLSL